MRNLSILFFTIILMLSACTSTSTSAKSSEMVVTKEIPRVIQITETPFPRNSRTSTLTPDTYKMMATKIANSIGTPIVAPDCYNSIPMTSSEIISCSNTRTDTMKKQMNIMVEAIQKRFVHLPENGKMFLKLQIEWEDLAKRECEFRTDSDPVRSYDECLVLKYQDRLRELQKELFILNQ